MNFEEQQEFFLPREISKEVLKRVITLIENKIITQNYN
jgi:hypothetical protein